MILIQSMSTFEVRKIVFVANLPVLFFAHPLIENLSAGAFEYG